MKHCTGWKNNWEYGFQDTTTPLKPNLSLTHSHPASVPLHLQFKTISTLTCTTERVHCSIASKKGKEGEERESIIIRPFNRIIKPVLKTYQVKRVRDGELVLERWSWSAIAGELGRWDLRWRVGAIALELALALWLWRPISNFLSLTTKP